MKYNMDYKKRLALSIGIILGFCMSFLLGMFFEKTQQTNTLKQEVSQVFITQQKTQLKVETKGAWVEVFVDGEKMDTP